MCLALSQAREGDAIRIEVHDFATGEVETIEWAWEDWQKPLFSRGKNIAKLYDLLYEGRQEESGAADFESAPWSVRATVAVSGALSVSLRDFTSSSVLLLREVIPYGLGKARLGGHRVRVVAQSPTQQATTVEPRVITLSFLSTAAQSTSHGTAHPAPVCPPQLTPRDSRHP